ncbi:MAG: hypothetical protein H0V20_07230, partial [Actinobacteria bacterium]|nr:hypothetical protein [Actinomycetota bacterium]
PDEAVEVKRLAKPPAPVWAINQLARRRRADVRALVKAAARLREVQGSGRGDFAKAATAERAAVAKLVAAAAGILREGGAAPTDATLGRVATTLHAAATSDESRGELERGRLRAELEPPGFGALLGTVPEPPAEKLADEVAQARERRAARDDLADARSRADAAQEQLEAAEEGVADARDELERAETDAARIRSELDEAQAKVTAAEKRLRKLER